jgi:hypothetical protein
MVGGPKQVADSRSLFIDLNNKIAEQYEIIGQPQVTTFSRQIIRTPIGKEHY